MFLKTSTKFKNIHIVVVSHWGGKNERSVTSLLSGAPLPPPPLQGPGNDKRVTTSSVYVLVPSLFHDVLHYNMTSKINLKNYVHTKGSTLPN